MTVRREITEPRRDSAAINQRGRGFFPESPVLLRVQLSFLAEHPKRLASHEVKPRQRFIQSGSRHL